MSVTAHSSSQFVGGVKRRMSTFIEDADVRALARDERPHVWGITLTALWPAPEAFQEAYAAFRAALVERLGDAGKSAYVYPQDALHVTVATLVSFRDSPLSRPSTTDAQQAMELRNRTIEAWRTALSNAFSVPIFDQAPFEVEIGRPILSPAAGYFSMSDVAGGISTIRDLVRRATSDPVFQTSGCPQPAEKGNLSIPNIVHSTFLRFVSEPSDSDGFRKAFAECAEKWVPMRALVTGVTLTLEDAPFMHVPVDEKHCIRVFSIGESTCR
eukprot:Opistho-2@21340